jgi:hypothetical protein
MHPSSIRTEIYRCLDCQICVGNRWTDILLYVILTSIKVKTYKFHSRVVVCGSLQSKCSLPSQLCLWVLNSTLALGVLTCYVHGQCFLQIVSVHLFPTQIWQSKHLYISVLIQTFALQWATNNHSRMKFICFDFDRGQYYV